MKKVRRKTNGVCKLTGARGNFVDSHLIPKAFTRPERAGAPLIQSGWGHPPRRRWSSWYDQSLVTREGEDILSSYDDWAISELRKRHLVWSGWGPALRLTANHAEISGTDWGIRTIDDLDSHRFRMFILSLLWRAAATTLPEFAEVELPEDDLERLRLMVLKNDSKPLSFYPASLTQLSTLGVIHNQTPFSQIKINPSFDGSPGLEIPIFRFYFDGLIIHVHRQASDNGETAELGPLIVGQESKIIISTVKYETSFQRENMELIWRESLMAAANSRPERQDS